MTDFDQMWTVHKNSIEFNARLFAARYSVGFDLMLQSARIALAIALEKPREHFRAFFLTVLKRKMLDDALAERGWRRLRDGHTKTPPMEDIADHLDIADESETPSPDVPVVVAQARRLPKLQRSILWLFMAEGLSFSEIGQRFGLSKMQAWHIADAAKATIRKSIA